MLELLLDPHAWAALVADGFEFHIPRGYIYFAMAFAGAVEAFNIMASRNRRRARPMQ
jgi:predicted tellurium resistance membrane protein TerC